MGREMEKTRKGTNRQKSRKDQTKEEREKQKNIRNELIDKGKCKKS
jgi:hypothetical protein